MNTITLQVSADTEQKLREKAGRLGLTLEIYLQDLAASAVQNATISAPPRREESESAPVTNESEAVPIRAAVRTFIGRGDELVTRRKTWPKSGMSAPARRPLAAGLAFLFSKPTAG